jgi:glutamine cyclotransferase
MKGRLSGWRFTWIVLLTTVHAVFGQSPTRPSKNQAPEYTFEVIRQLPHDSKAFTQGLTYHDGCFYEGTGRQGHSSLRQVDPETGRVIRKTDLGPEFFGEGTTILDR